MNGYLAEALIWLILIIPAALIALKLSYPKVPWWTIILPTPVLSWVIMVGAIGAYAPDNGMSSLVTLMIGWAYMPPFLALFSLNYLIKPLRGSKPAKILAVLLVLTAVVLPISAGYRWLPEAQAVEIAREELQEAGFTNFEIVQTQKTRDGWTIIAELPNHSHYPVYLSRSGFVTARGG